MKKLISKALTLAMLVSAFAVPVKADTTNGTVLYEDNLNSASLITVSGGGEANRVFQWYSKDGAVLKDSNKGLTPTGTSCVALWEVPADFDPTKEYTLEFKWAHTQWNDEVMIYSKADDGSFNYERYLNNAGGNTYTIQMKYENGQIMRKRSTESSYGNYSGASQKLWAIGVRQASGSGSYIDNIVLKQGDKTWTEDFENASATDFQNQALKINDNFKPSAKFIETGAAGTGDKKIYLPAKGSNNGPWAYLKLPSITNGVYELSVDYVVGKANNDYFYINHENGKSETYQMNNSDANAGKLTRLKITIDKDNNKVKTSWIGADGTDKGTEFAITDSTPITNVVFRNHSTATQNSWVDNVEFKRISGSEEFNPEVVGETILAQADFEDYNKTYDDYGFYTNGSKAYVGGKNGRGITPALTSGDYSGNERYMGYALSNANNGAALGEGTYHVRFSYNSYDNASTNAIYLANASNVAEAYKLAILPTATLNSYQNQWVDVDIKFEIPSLKWTATLTPQTGDVYTASGTYSNTSGQIPAIQWWAKPTKNFKEYVAPALDNFYVTKELVNTDLADSAFMLVANQSVIGNKNVPVSGVSALVDFGNDAAIAAVSKDNVKLLENGVEIDYNGYAEATMWVVEPGELKYDTTYAISIEKGIPDGNGAIINPRTYVFKTVRETVIPENNILGDVDFEDWTVDTQSENYGGSDTTPGDGFTVWSTSGFVAGPDGTGQAMPMYMSAAVARSMQFWPVGKMKNATYYAEFDYKVGEDFTDNTFYMDRGPVEFKDAQAQDIITTDEMKSFGSGWVKVSFKLIHPSNVWSVKVTNELGKTVLEKTGSYPGANQEMTHLGWSFTRGSSATIDKAGAVDNFLMWLEYDNAPEITKDSIKIYEGDVIQPAGRISPDSDKIVVDFGQRIKASEIAAIANNVYIVDNATKEKIELAAKDYAYDSGVLTISLQNVDLAFGKAYTLHINALSNIASMQMEKEYDFNFIVAKSNLKVRIAQISQNDAVVAAPAKLTEGEAKVTVAFNNGTGTDTTLYLIVANYDEDGKLISADYKPVAAPSDNQDKTEEITVAVEGYTTTFMIWDGFATMNPMADTLEF